MTVSAAVVALTQLAKWAGIPDRWGPLAVLVASALGVAVWTVSSGPLGQKAAFDLFAGWVAVATSAAGVFGFTRAAASAVISAAPPTSGGAGSSRTESAP